MREGKSRRCARAALLSAALSASVWGQTNPNSLQNTTVSSTSSRVTVNSSVANPLVQFAVLGYQGMYCARPFAIVSGTTLQARAHLDLRMALFRLLSELNTSQIRNVLQRAEQQGATREEQFERLFGMPLPPLSEQFGLTTIGEDLVFRPSYEQQTQLHMGREVTHVFLDDDGKPKIACMTVAQVDAAIAEAKRVYAAVISAMQTQQLQQRR